MPVVYGIIYREGGTWKLHDKFWNEVTEAVPAIQPLRSVIQARQQAQKVWDQSLPPAMICEVHPETLVSIGSYATSLERKDADSQNQEEARIPQGKEEGTGTAAQFDCSADLP